MLAKSIGALITVGVLLTTIFALPLAPPAYSIGAHGKGAGFAKQIFKENRQKEKQKAGKRRKKHD
jgi:hypothetical protein